MVEEQIRARGVRDARVLAAMRRAAAPPVRAARAAATRPTATGPLPIARGQTISQPYIVARMLELAELEPGQRVLEIGTGTGYQTALLAALAGEVYSVERIHGLLESARVRLAARGARRRPTLLRGGRDAGLAGVRAL